jgi:hypothetical protein
MREGLEGETYAGRYVVADARLASPVAAGEGTVVVRAGFARLSGLATRRQLGGISRRIFQLTRRRYSDNENRDAQFARKNGQEGEPSVTRPIAPRQKPSPAAGVVFYRGGTSPE